jgi:predicted RNA-binding protein
MAPSAGRGRGGTLPLTVRPGHNRYLWDYRWSANGPLAAPGKYRAAILPGTVADAATAAPQASAEFEVQIDPGVLEDGVTMADLLEQQNFLLQVRDAITAANQLRTRTQQAMEKADIQPAKSPGPGEWVSGMSYAHPLQRIWARLVTAPGIYEQGMLIDQLGNIVRAEGGADQKVGAESRKRFEDLLGEMKAIEGELSKITP